MTAPRNADPDWRGRDRVHPVWDPGFAAFGFWLFGIFIPVVII